MMRALAVSFLIAHGLVHAAIYATPPDTAKQAPFDPARSWAVAAGHVPRALMRTVSVRLAWITAAAFAVAGMALAAGLQSWPLIAAVAAVTGLALKIVYFHPWLSAGVLIDVAIVVAAANDWPPSLT
jgi:hypothetical protein